MIETGEKKKLGELIVELGLMDNRDLGQALSIAKETSLPLGRVLVLSEMLSEEVLMATLRCQSLILQDLLEIELAGKAMQMVSKENAGLDDALFKLGWNPSTTQDSTPLGELLVDAGYATREQLQQSLEKSSSSGLPFGRLLVFSGALTEGLLTGALNAQILIRDEKLSKEQAVEALKEAKQRQVSVEIPLKEKGFYDLPSRSCPRLGELLLFCGVISQSDLVSALELGLMNKTPVGQVLIESGQVTSVILEAALQVQNLMAEQKISITDARTVIGSVKDGSSLDEALEALQAEEEAGEPERTFLSLFDFLKNLGRIDDEQANEAFQLAKHNSDVLSQVLLISGSLDAETVSRAEKCRKLVQDKKLNGEHANIAFDYAERFNVNVTQALKELHWYTPDEDAADEEAATPPEPRIKTKEDKSQPKDAASPENGREQGKDVPAQEAGSRQKAEAEPPIDPAVRRQTEWEKFQKQVAHLSVSGKVDKAIEIATVLLRLAEEHFPERTISSLDSVAELSIQRRNLDQAEQYYARALELRKASKDEDGGLLAEGYCNCGKVSYFKKDFPVAEEFARKFIEVVALSKGKEHPNVACGWQNLANIFYAQKKYPKALKAYQVGIQICKKGLGDSHPATVQMQKSYDVVQQAVDAEESAGVRDNAALGFITGSWRTLPHDASQALHEQ